MAGVLASTGARATWTGAPDYPPVLCSIPDPPPLLFYRGDLARFLDGPAVAVIGSRRGSPYGLGVARSLSRSLGAAGVRVVSGLARGIDGEAHRGCLEGGGMTMAVLGSGLDVPYPREHAPLLERIAGQGVAVTEHPPGTPPGAFNFPRRNRLISGFSRAVVVVEAGERSGTMITVDAALEQGRDVLAVPGEISRRGATGTNRLIRDGAGVVTCVEDILDTLGLARPSREQAGAPPAPNGGAGIIALLSEGPVHFDRLARALAMSAPELHSVLLDLELAGRVVQRPGKLYCLP